MPRRSAASLSVIQPIPGQRPPPPESLTQHEATIWAAVVATKPADWFLPDIFPLLAAYCRAVATWERLSAELDLVPARTVRDKEGLAHIRQLTHVVEKQARLMTDLATRMRMTPQSRWQPSTAASKQNSARGNEPPWLQKASGT